MDFFFFLLHEIEKLHEMLIQHDEYNYIYKINQNSNHVIQSLQISYKPLSIRFTNCRSKSQFVFELCKIIFQKL